MARTKRCEDDSINKWDISEASVLCFAPPLCNWGRGLDICVVLFSIEVGSNRLTSGEKDEKKVARPKVTDWKCRVFYP